MIDVFICTYNPNRSYLQQTVNALLSQDLNRDEWNLTVIDNNSKSPVADFDFIKAFKVAVVVEKQQGLTAARKCATNIAKGDLIVFVDDDNILDSNYLSISKKLFVNEQVGILSGNILPSYVLQPGRWFKKFEPMLAIREIVSESELILNEKTYYNSFFPIGAGMVIRKQLIEEYYKDQFTTENYIDGRKGDELTASEDIDLDLYALNKGYKIGVSPRLRMLHIIPPNRIEPNYIVKLAQGNLKSGMQVNKKWAPVFKHNIFDFNNDGLFKLVVGVVLFKLTSFLPSSYIRYHIFKEILKYKKEFKS